MAKAGRKAATGVRGIEAERGKSHGVGSYIARGKSQHYIDENIKTIQEATSTSGPPAFPPYSSTNLPAFAAPTAIEVMATIMSSANNECGSDPTQRLLC